MLIADTLVGVLALILWWSIILPLDDWRLVRDALATWLALGALALGTFVALDCAIRGVP